MARNPKGGSVKPDFASIGGIILAVGGILAGLTLEGGSVRDVAQVTAAMIVLGGTLGAVMLTTPPHVLLGAFKKLPMVFLSDFFKQFGIFCRVAIFWLKCVFIPEICRSEFDFFIDNYLVKQLLLETINAKKALASDHFTFPIFPSSCDKKALENSNDFTRRFLELMVIGTIGLFFMPKSCQMIVNAPNEVPLSEIFL